MEGGSHAGLKVNFSPFFSSAYSGASAYEHFVSQSTEHKQDNISPCLLSELQCVLGLQTLFVTPSTGMSDSVFTVNSWFTSMSPMCSVRDFFILCYYILHCIGFSLLGTSYLVIFNLIPLFV